jgi:hypothetical protein
MALIRLKKVKQRKGARRMLGRIARSAGGIVGRGIKCLRCKLRIRGRRLGAHTVQASGNAVARRAKRKFSNPRTTMPASLHDKGGN